MLREYFNSNFNNDRNISAYYDTSKKSKNKEVLKGGETVSQSDYWGMDRRYNAVKLFDKNDNTIWHSNRHIRARRSRFPRNLYKRISPYHSIYRTLDSGDTNKSTFGFTRLSGEQNGIHGSWAQITYKNAFVPGPMYIKMRNNRRNYINWQERTVKKLAIVGTNQGNEVPDEDKIFDLITRVDYGTRYSQTVTIEANSISGGKNITLRNGKIKLVIESFEVYINNKLLETISLEPTQSIKRTYNASYIGLDQQGLMIKYINGRDFNEEENGISFSEFKINDVNVKPFFVYNKDIEATKITDGKFKKSGEYSLEWNSLQDKRYQEKMEILQEDFLIKNGDYQTYRLIIEELYGGIVFGISEWNISKKREGFNNMRNTIKDNKNNMLNPIYTNLPVVSGISLIEGYEGIKGTMRKEERVVELLNEFNNEYATYIRCNGLHLKDSERQNCSPIDNYYRLPAKIVIEFTVANGEYSGSSSWNSFSFYGLLPDSSTEEMIGTPFNQTLGNSYARGSYHKIVLNKNQLNGLQNFAGQITKMSLSFGISKLQFYKFKVDIFDNRGKEYNFINLQANILGEPITGDNWDENRADVINVNGNGLYFYDKGLDRITALHSQLISELDSMKADETEINDAINIDTYNNNHQALKSSIDSFNDLRYDLDTKLRELYMIDGTTSSSKKLEYDGTMFSGVLWTVLATTVLYYTLYELD